MIFEDLKFEETSYGGIQAKAIFGDYELSVIKEPNKSLYEVAVFLGVDGPFVQLPGIHKVGGEPPYDDVIPYLSQEQVTVIMKKLATITKG
jgi:hypothetical protein